VIASATTSLEGVRPDLLYRINVVTVTMPPLRERRDDILPLAETFAAKRKKIDPSAKELLVAHPWPGNVRELRNAIERAVLTGEDDAIRSDALQMSGAEFVTAAARGKWTLDQLEENYIRAVLKETRSNYSKAAEILGINRKTLLEKRKKYGLE